MDVTAIIKAVWAFRLPVFLAIAFGCGFGLEYKLATGTAAKLVVATEEANVKLLLDQRAQISRDLLRAQEASIKIDAFVKANTAKIDKIKAAVNPLVIFRDGDKVNASPSGIPYLDDDTVRMLNAARSSEPGATANPASISDGSSTNGNPATADTAKYPGTRTR